MDFINEHHTPFWKAHEEGDHVFRGLQVPGQDLHELHAALPGEEPSDRRFAQSRLTGKERVIQRLFALLGGASGEPEVVDHPALADKVIETLGRAGFGRGRSGGCFFGPLLRWLRSDPSGRFASRIASGHASKPTASRCPASPALRGSALLAAHVVAANS